MCLWLTGGPASDDQEFIIKKISMCLGSQDLVSAFLMAEGHHRCLRYCYTDFAGFAFKEKPLLWTKWRLWGIVTRTLRIFRFDSKSQCGAVGQELGFEFKQPIRLAKYPADDQIQWSSKRGWIVASASLGNLLDMQILGYHPTPLNQKPWGWGLVICVVTIPPDDFDAL